jgi:hypothetical protein
VSSFQNFQPEPSSPYKDSQAQGFAFQPQGTTASTGATFGTAGIPAFGTSGTPAFGTAGSTFGTAGSTFGTAGSTFGTAGIPPFGTSANASTASTGFSPFVIGAPQHQQPKTKTTKLLLLIALCYKKSLITNDEKSTLKVCLLILL